MYLEVYKRPPFITKLMMTSKVMDAWSKQYTDALLSFL